MRGREKRKAARVNFEKAESIRISFRAPGGDFQGSIWDYSRFGLGVRLTEGPNFPEKGDPITDIHITAFNESRFLGRGVIARKATVEGDVIFGIFLEQEFIDLDFLLQHQKIVLHSDEIKQVQYYFRYSHNISPDFKIFSSDFAYELAIFQRKLDELDAKFESEAVSLKENLFRSVVSGLGKEMHEFLDHAGDRLEKETVFFSQEEQESHGFYLRRVIWPYILQSPLLTRSNQKPLGYAGDFSLMEMIYRNDWQTESSFGRILNKYPLERPMAHSIRYRNQKVNESLNRYLSESGGTSNMVLSAGCGSAWEATEFFTSSPYRYDVHLFLMDQEVEALTSARERIDSIPTDRPFRTTIVRQSMRTMRPQSDPSLSGMRFHFIYALGLIDSFTQPVARAVVNKLYQLLEPGGRLLVSNFHLRNPDRMLMEYIMDWPVVHRSEDQMRDLVSDINGNFRSDVNFDPFDCQMYLEISRFS